MPSPASLRVRVGEELGPMPRLGCDRHGRTISPCRGDHTPGVPCRNAATEPRDPARRDRRDTRAGPRLRQPRLPPRPRRAHPAALCRQAMDRLQARVQGPAAHPAPAARPLHGAVLPRRRDCVRRGTPAMCGVPAVRLRPVPRARRRSRAPTRSTSGCTPSASADHVSARAFDELPDGTFVLEDGEPWLLLGQELLRWTPGGYAERRERPAGEALLITPPTTVDVLRAGGRPSFRSCTRPPSRSSPQRRPIRIYPVSAPP